MTDFLLELRSEEIPARMQAGARAELEKLFAKSLADAGIAADSIQVWSTPRRLALIAKGLPAETPAISEERKGPRADAPAPAIEGFLRSTGLTRKQLVERDIKGQAVLFAVIEIPGRATKMVLAEAIPAIIRGFSWPKSMRWGDDSISTESLKWVRPLSGIVALFGAEIVDCSIGGIASGRETYGHRFHYGDPITIHSAADYAASLMGGHVIVDHEERARIIREGAAKVAGDAGLSLVEDEGLVIENAGLTEWPVPLLGSFDPAFLAVPPEVIQLTARVNQKYFICRTPVQSPFVSSEVETPARGISTSLDANGVGSLSPNFICTANIIAKDGGAAIVAGNEKVLAARLSDAKFFWELDQKKTLAQHGEKLPNIVFHEKLGTVGDKVERVAKLARWLVEQNIVVPAQAGTSGSDAQPPAAPAFAGATELADLAETAARLCKADLVTEMVGEFPELQGVMGGYYAAAEGLDPLISDAIAGHYGAKLTNPPNYVLHALSLADKLDTLNQFFSIGEKPTGSRDPFALRRAAILSLFLINGTLKSYDWSSVLRADVIDFIVDRWIVQNSQPSGRPDIIKAITSLGRSGNFIQIGAKMRAIQAFVETAEGANLLAGYKRAANILKKEAPRAPAKAGAQGGTEQIGEMAQSGPGLLPSQEHIALEPAESALITALDSAELAAETAIAAEDFTGAMAALATLRAPIDAFFDTVIVNDPDPEIRARRLALLERIRVAVHKVADFSKIDG